MYVYGVLESASDFFIIGVDEELQTLVVTTVDNVLFESVAQGLINRGVEPRAARRTFERLATP